MAQVYNRLITWTVTCVTGPRTGPKDHPVKMKCHRFQKQFKYWIDYETLEIYLRQKDPEYYPEAILERYNIESERERLIKHLWTYLNSQGDEKGSGYEKLIDCLEHSIDKASFKHLGHDSLLKLLKCDCEKSFFESDDYKCNVAIQGMVRGNDNFIEMTNVNTLQPFMVKNGLLTYYDKARLDKMTWPDDANYLLTRLLDTKGHRAYIVFLDCLIESVEDRDDYHAGHFDIIKKIKSELKSKGLHIGSSTGKKEVPF